jgi:hypothetical protein
MWVIQVATKIGESTSSPIHLQHPHASVLLLTFWNRNWALCAQSHSEILLLLLWKYLVVMLIFVRCRCHYLVAKTEQWRLLGVTGGGCALRGDSYFPLEKRHERIDCSGVPENLMQLQLF